MTRMPLVMFLAVAAIALAVVDAAQSPGPHRVVFQSNRDGRGQIYVMHADGTDQANLTQTSSTDYHPHGSPDGSKVAFISRRDGNNEIYVMNADGSSPRRLTNDPAADANARWLPARGK